MYLKRWGAIALLACSGVLGVSGDAPAKLTRDDAQKLKSPVANTKKSIDRGRVIFMQNCTSCHGEDGKAEGSLVASATDLTSPQLYKSGTSEGEIFHSIRDGAGDQMPAFKSQIDYRNRHLEFGEFRPQPVAGVRAGRQFKMTSKSEETQHEREHPEDRE